MVEGVTVRRVRSQHGEHSKPTQIRLSRSLTSSLQRYFKHHSVAPEGKQLSEETQLEEGFQSLNRSSGVLRSTDSILNDMQSEKSASNCMLQKESSDMSETDNDDVMSFKNKAASPNSGMKKIKRKVTFNDSSRKDKDFVRIKVIEESVDL